MREACGCTADAAWPPGQGAARAGSLPADRRPPGRRVVVEVYLFQSGPGGMLAYRCLSGYLKAAESPDAAAARIGGTATRPEVTPAAVHSTSWRHRANGSIVLTYAVLPDPRPDLPAVPLTSLEIARGSRPDRPSPESVHREQVAAHAARHLAMVARTDPGVRDVLTGYPALGRMLAALPMSPAGQMPG